MNLDTHTEHNPNAPWNQKENEPLTELEEQQQWNMELVAKIKKAKEQLAYCILISSQTNNVLLHNNLLKIKL